MLTKEKSWFIIVFVLFTLITVEAQQTIWFSPYEMFDPEGELRVVPYGGAVIVSSNTISNALWVNRALTLTQNQKIDSVIINYQVSNPGTYISQIRLTYSKLITMFVMKDEVVELNSTTATSFSIPVDITVDGVMTLILRFNFTDPADQITIGAIGIVISQPTSSMNDISQKESSINFKLDQNYPNPFNPSTKIDYFLKSSDKVKINIYDSNGSLVRTLLNEEQIEGPNSVIWNGKNNYGELVSSGVYFYQLQVGNYKEAKKMIMLK